MTTKSKLFYTGGLHTFPRGQAIHRHFLSKLSLSSGLYEIVKLTISLQHLNLAPKIPSTSTALINTHPVYTAIKRSFTPYATALMTLEILSCFSLELYPLSPSIFHITDPPSGRTYKVQLSPTTCSCPFSRTHLLVCRHVFKVFSVMQLKTIDYFDHLKYWREEVGLKKKKVKRDRTRW